MGYGVPRDVAKGREWIEKAARLGDPDAKAALEKFRPRDSEQTTTQPDRPPDNAVRVAPPLQ
jgi:TPR repeat protein